MKVPKEFDIFDQAMETILRANPKAVKEAMEAEKQANAEKRKAKTPSASDRASGDND
jgi:hypothetical protein